MFGWRTLFHLLWRYGLVSGKSSKELKSNHFKIMCLWNLYLLLFRIYSVLFYGSHVTLQPMNQTSILSMTVTFTQHQKYWLCIYNLSWITKDDSVLTFVISKLSELMVGWPQLAARCPPSYSFTPPPQQDGNKIGSKSWVNIRTGRSFTNYDHGQNKLDLEKINLLPLKKKK